MKSSNIGGQAVMEGIMMKSGDDYAVAVRKPDKEIEVKVSTYSNFIKKHKAFFSLPIVRGVFNFVDSLVLGMSCLTWSANFALEDAEEEEPGKVEKALDKATNGKTNDLLLGLTVAFSIVMSVAIFMMLPYFISTLLQKVTSSTTLITLAEGALRILIFVAYILLISRMKDIQRVFMYHGAEHKCINCIEHGLDLTVENVMKSSKEHKRCGTSFLLIVMIISIIFFLFIRVESPLWRVVTRLLLIPVIAGVSYEFIRLAGNSDSKFVNLLSKPGMGMQHLTTKEPTPDMVEVAIAAVEAVFDWRAYLTENFGKVYTEEERKKTIEAHVVRDGETAEAAV
ncbi:MAG: DUF1385 domain-containing protein [Eubacteriales bacterium]|nr:DUF1385 domain-containing protein [Eubacteriales bacterium]